jgi:SAM-dependent methyltransferase
MIVNDGIMWRIRALVPTSLRSFLLGLYCILLDAVASVYRRDELSPPKRLLRLSTDPTSDFRETGRSLVRFLVAQCGLRPSHRVLDVGSGVGRLAVALTEYLDSGGSYDGFDVVPQEVAWCTAHISPKFPHFRFQLADVRNPTYHPAGRTSASQYRFPYDDGCFDLVVVASVFTHMLSHDTEHYLREIARVLKQGGRCFVSFYLLDDEARRNISAGISAFDFKGVVNGCCVQREDAPETAVAYDADRVQALFDELNLPITAVLRGEWSSTKAQLQDIVIASRPS